MLRLWEGLMSKMVRVDEECRDLLRLTLAQRYNCEASRVDILCQQMASDGSLLVIAFMAGTVNILLSLSCILNWVKNLYTFLVVYLS